MSSTPPPTDEETLTQSPQDKNAFTQVARVLTIFRLRMAGKDLDESDWREFRLADGEFEELESRLKQNESLFVFEEDKLRCFNKIKARATANATPNRYDYDADT
jgi:hypothetical protein